MHDILKEAIEVGQLCTADFQGTVYVYTPEAYEEENYIAQRIQEMAAMKPLPMKTHVQLFLDRWQDSCHFELADKQSEAVEKSLGSGMTVITGGPGTGKTDHHPPGRTGRAAHPPLCADRAGRQTPG
ncbi:hypothetical protein [Megasphaera elsdenii]|uniref:hypothetical protein n=1 Tax=Megasphaera elsdenii TaxID=907 RepID=UPI003397A778